jgi:hypothetical protein
MSWLWCRPETQGGTDRRNDGHRAKSRRSVSVSSESAEENGPNKGKGGARVNNVDVTHEFHG